ncbi:activating transcription factor 7-interacting protein 1 [Amyelois transitella]|uniref:activating transcription factor 7-interacting protein 1 n=1 Tax=Amyelois transitella TaxID=680683 RepID=UPI00298FE5E6|nr:activating transcription factor 7-interacting protein 1 [Amyelois transitella]XP_013188618.2 activating transcription factor 7-interacting protein 1 [Amyelois transitella]XP_060802423.1 activating transcription factor 7-interacting protein 1 [Amyelois transitella]
MQLILDAETDIDIRKNMSSLNEELTEKLDGVIQDLKSELCNSNKENVKSNDNKISCDDKPHLEDVKVDEVLTPSSPVTDKGTNNDDDNIAKNVNNEGNKDRGTNVVSEDNSHNKIDNGNLSVMNQSEQGNEHGSGNGSNEKVGSSNNVKEKLGGTGDTKVIVKQINDQNSHIEDDTCTLEHVSPTSTEQTEESVEKKDSNNELGISEEMDVIVENKHSEDDPNVVNQVNKDIVRTESDITSEVDAMLQNSNNGSEQIIENIVEVSKLKEVPKSPNAYSTQGPASDSETLEKQEVIKQSNCKNILSLTREKVETVNLESDVVSSEKCSYIVDSENAKNNIEKIAIDMKTDETLEKKNISATEIMDVDVNDATGKPDIEASSISVSSEKDCVINIDCEDDLEQSPMPEENSVGNTENIKILDKKQASEDLVKITNDDKIILENKEITKNSSHSDGLSGNVIQESNLQENPKCSDQLLKPSYSKIPDEREVKQPDIENIINVLSTVKDIETVNLDDKKTETESSKTCSNLNIRGTVSDDSTAKVKESVIGMETVDLIDDKDSSETEAMDVDVNNETGETNTAEKDEIINLDCEDNIEENTTDRNGDILKNSDMRMDEDKHLVDNDNIKETNVSGPIDKPDETANEKKNDKDIPKTFSQKTKDVSERKNIPSVLKLSNTLNILSDDEDEETIQPKQSSQPETKDAENSEEKQCINIDDDDDIMLVDEVGAHNKDTPDKSKTLTARSELSPKLEDEIKDKTADEKPTQQISQEVEKPVDEKKTEEEKEESSQRPQDDVKPEVKTGLPKPLIPNNFLKTCKKTMAEMTRDDLEEFCILKIVESVVDRSSLSEIKTKLKSMAQSIEEYKKKAMLLTKQNRDLQVVLKTIQEEQKNSKTVTPLKITRSVGMQVLMTERSIIKRKGPPGQVSTVTNTNVTTPTKSPRLATQRTIKVPITPSPQSIPVPRLVPASNSPATKNVQQINTNNNAKVTSPVNGVRTNQGKTEKRGINRASSVTVDLTEDEPPTKITNRNSTPTPVRVVAPHLVPQNLLPVSARHPVPQNNPRKVYIPISGTQNQVRPGQAIMLKSVNSAPSQSPRPRVPQAHMGRHPQNQIRMTRISNRHPAPLPESTKIYPGSNLKALPPAPDLKLSKVENGIVISWKIDGYQEDSYEEIASYQLYAYQETNTTPSTALWKKIGDVKALPLPMACTLTQFVAGFKYYFAVRAVDIRSRIGPFSLPGSILLLNKI